MSVRTVAVAASLAITGACAHIGGERNDTTHVSQQVATDPELAGVPLEADGYMALESTTDMWCEYRCANFPGRWRADYPTDVYAAPGLNPQVIGQLAPGEIVNAVRYQRRVKPRRGVVTRAGGGLEVGEVVFMIGGEEMATYLLRHGADYVLQWEQSDADPEIAFAEDYDTTDWVFVERSGGRPNGWLRSPMMPGMEFPLEE